MRSATLQVFALLCVQQLLKLKCTFSWWPARSPVSPQHSRILLLSSRPCEPDGMCRSEDVHPHLNPLKQERTLLSVSSLSSPCAANAASACMKPKSACLCKLAMLGHSEYSCLLLCETHAQSMHFIPAAYFQPGFIR